MEKQLPNKKEKRGFGSIDPEEQRLTGSPNGRVAHEQGKAHERNREEGRKAGKKSTVASVRRRNIDRAENDGCDHVL